jgi:hypothetical protein
VRGEEATKALAAAASHGTQGDGSRQFERQCEEDGICSEGRALPASFRLQKEGKKVKSFEPFRLLFLAEAQYPLPHLSTRNATAHILLKISFLVL